MGVVPAFRWGGALGWAWIADRRRVRHPVLVGAALAAAACHVPLLAVRTVPAMLVVVAAISLFQGPLVPMLDATVMDHLPRLGGDYGRLRLWGSTGFIVGAGASAVAITAASPAVVPVLLLVPALAVAPAFLGLPRTQLGERGFGAPWALFTAPLAVLLAVAFLVNFSAGAWGGLFALHTSRLGLPDALPGVAWDTAVAAEVVVLWAGRRLLAAVGPERLLAVALAVTAVRWAVTAVVTSPVLLVAVQAGQGFTFGAFHLATLTLVAELVPRQASTTGQALYGLTGFGLGGALGAALAGLVVERIGTSALFGVEALVATVALAPALALRRLRQRATRDCS